MVYCNCEVAVKTSVNVGWGKPHPTNYIDSFYIKHVVLLTNQKD